MTAHVASASLVFCFIAIHNSCLHGGPICRRGSDCAGSLRRGAEVCLGEEKEISG